MLIKRINKSASAVLCLSLTLSHANLLAQNTTPPVLGNSAGAVGVAAIGGVVYNKDGTYNVNQMAQNNSAIASELIGQMNLQQKVDRDYLLGVAEQMNAQIANLIKLRTDFLTLSLKSQTDLAPIEDYVALTIKIKELDGIINNDLATKTTISRESLPSASIIEIGDLKLSSNNYGNIDFSKLTKSIQDQQQTILAEMDAMQFVHLVTKLKQPFAVTAHALTPNLKGIKILTGKEMEALDNEIRELTNLSEDTKKLQRRYTDRLVTLINDFVNNYGNKEWLRPNDANDRKAINETFSQISDAFYRRSYLRKKYGFRMGAIQSTDYPKQIGNFEKYALQPLKEALKSFRREPALEDADVLQAFENARNFVQLYDEKITPILASRADIMKRSDKKDDYSSNDTGFLVRVNSVITKFTDQTQTAELLLMIMRQVLADIREEKMLLANDRLAVAAYSDSRFRATGDIKKQNDVKMCQMDFTLSQQTHSQYCVPAGVKVKAQRPAQLSGTSIADIFGNLLGRYQNVESANRQEAQMKQDLLDTARLGDSTESQDQQNDLFK